MTPRPVYIRGRAAYTAAGKNGLSGTVAQPNFVTLDRLKNRPQRPFFFCEPQTPSRLQIKSYSEAVERLTLTIDAALERSNLTPDAFAHEALFLGSTAQSITLLEQQRRSGSSKGSILSTNREYCDRLLQRRYCPQGFSVALSTACTSSAQGILQAATVIAAGHCDRAIVCGFETYNDTSLYGFESLGLLAKRECAPLDCCSEGIVLGEGCAAVVLDSQAGPGAWRFLGGASSIDVHSPTANAPDGAAIASVMSRALTVANISARKVSLVKAHATGSVANDQAECAALIAAFDGASPAITALKGYCGHLLGACGVVEMVLLIDELDNKTMPAVAGLRAPVQLPGFAPLQAPAAYAGGAVMLNHFGFGGSLVSLVIAPG